jgi:hypothetical protein
MDGRITAWQCIGCGRIEGPRPCIGVCEDRRTEFVYAADHDAVLAQLAAAHSEMEEIKVIVRQIAHTTPHRGECERTWHALQARAREVLQALDSNTKHRAP